MKRENKKREAVKIMLTGTLEDYILHLKRLAVATS
jgi:hypothetical protein